MWALKFSSHYHNWLCLRRGLFSRLFTSSFGSTSKFRCGWFHAIYEEMCFFQAAAPLRWYKLRRQPKTAEIWTECKCVSKRTSQIWGQWMKLSLYVTSRKQIILDRDRIQQVITGRTTNVRWRPLRSFWPILVLKDNTQTNKGTQGDDITSPLWLSLLCGCSFYRSQSQEFILVTQFNGNWYRLLEKESIQFFFEQFWDKSCQTRYCWERANSKKIRKSARCSKTHFLRRSTCLLAVHKHDWWTYAASVREKKKKQAHSKLFFSFIY